MASDTVPAAADGPNTPPDTAPSTATGTQPATPSGGLSGLLAPVQPVRATFNLNPDQAATHAADGVDVSAGVSSSDYHPQNGQETTQNSNSTGASGKQQQSIWRAWMLAGAKRWEKGADARNKALDIKKARAQALQVKETRTVNRAEKHVGGSTSTGASTNSNSGKSLASKTSNTGKNGGSKNSNGTGSPTRSGSSGRGANHRPGAGGHGGGAGRNSGGANSGRQRSNGGGTGKTNTHGSGSKPSSSGKDTAKPSKPDHGGKRRPGLFGSKGGSGTSGAGKGGGSGSSGTAGARGSAGKDGKPGKDAKDTSGHRAPDKTRKVDLAKKPGSKTRPDDGKHSPKTSKTPDSKAKSAADDKKTPGTGKKPTAPTTATGTGKPINTQESRETGYRDGVRAATVAAHVEAWRDGARDGWKDRKADAAREKARLDQAHANRTQTVQPQPQKVPPMPTEPPTNNREPQPIQVTAVTEDGVSLGTGADRSSIGHGEVRRLKDYERKMRVKADTMARIAEGSRGLQEHAEQQLKHITSLTEQARIVDGGAALLTALAKLQEDAKIQAQLADDVIRRAARSAEACNVLLTNVETRYGSIYKAVVDSGLIKPAHLRYYEDTVNA